MVTVSYELNRGAPASRARPFQRLYLHRVGCEWARISVTINNVLNTFVGKPHTLYHRTLVKGRHRCPQPLKNKA